MHRKFDDRAWAEPQQDSANVACQAFTGAASKKYLEGRRDHVMRVADYLYGGTILEAALAVLEAEGRRSSNSVSAFSGPFWCEAHPDTLEAFLLIILTPCMLLPRPSSGMNLRV
jgi:hypothetical protein